MTRREFRLQTRSVKAAKRSFAADRGNTGERCNSAATRLSLRDCIGRAMRLARPRSHLAEHVRSPYRAYAQARPARHESLEIVESGHFPSSVWPRGGVQRLPRVESLVPK